MENDNLKELEALKLKAEIEKIKSENDEIKKRISHGIWNTKTIIQTTVAGIVAAALISAWLVGYFQPIMGKKQELFELQNKIDATSNKLLLDSINKVISFLLIENKRIQRSRDDLESKLKDLVVSYENQASLNENERSHYNFLIRQAESQIEELKGQPYKALKQDKQIKDWLTNHEWIIQISSSPYHVFKSKNIAKCSFTQNGAFIYNGKIIKGNSWKVENGELTIKVYSESVTVTGQIYSTSPDLIIATTNKKGKNDTWEIKLDENKYKVRNPHI